MPITEEERLRMLRKAYGVSPSAVSKSNYSTSSSPSRSKSTTQSVNSSISPNPKAKSSQSAAGKDERSKQSPAETDAKPAAAASPSAASATNPTNTPPAKPPRPPIKRSTYVPETPLFGLTPDAFQVALFAFLPVHGCVGVARTCKDWHHLLQKPKFLKTIGLFTDKTLADLRAEQEECDMHIDMAGPYLHHARTSLEEIDRRMMQEIQALPKPPARVDLVAEAVLTLLDVKRTDWMQFKYETRNPLAFLERLRNFDGRNVTREVSRKMDEYIGREEFDPTYVMLCSMAMGHLCAWVRGVDHYARVWQQVEPKRAEVRERRRVAELCMKLLE